MENKVVPTCLFHYKTEEELNAFNKGIEWGKEITEISSPLLNQDTLAKARHFIITAFELVNGPLADPFLAAEHREELVVANEFINKALNILK